MIGAIIGDIVGSRYERYNHKSKDFELFDKKCHPTDDSIMSLAVAKAILDSEDDADSLPINAIACMQEWEGYIGMLVMAKPSTCGSCLRSHYHIIVMVMDPL